MSTKTSACIRLTISLLAAALLTILLIMGMSGKSLFGFGNLNWGIKYANADKYSAGNATFPADDLNDIRINWIDGEVNVLPCDGENIEIEESASGNLSEKEKVHYYYNKRTLYIQYAKSSSALFSIGNKHKKNKSLTLRIPKTLCGSLSNFELATVSSHNDISGLSCSDMEIDNVSGETIFTDVEVTNKLDFDNVSGDITLQGSFAELDIDTVSGACFIDNAVTPSSFSLDTVSGGCELMLPYSAEFCAEIDKVSGNLNFDGFKVTKDDDEYICGNSRNEFEFDTVSGDITIIQKEQGVDDNSQNYDDSQDSDDSQGNDSQDYGSSQSGYGSQSNSGYGHGYGHHDDDH